MDQNILAILGKIPAMVQKKVRKKFGQFFGRFQREEASSFLALTPPEFFTFPGGGVQTPPEFFAFPGGGSWGVLICPPPPEAKRARPGGYLAS